MRKNHNEAKQNNNRPFRFKLNKAEFVNAKTPLFIMAFIIPAAVLFFLFVAEAGFPLPLERIIKADLQWQYYPFLSDYHQRIRSGSSLLWSWSHGGGTDYFALWAYYLTSPLYIPLLFLPHSWLLGSITALMFIKIGLAGLFMCMYLTDENKEKGISPLAPIFSSFYALCGFTICYHLNILWLDSFALLPFVIQGLNKVVREGKYKQYVITLTLCVFSNFHFSLYTCIFVALTFFGLCVTQKYNLKTAFYKLKSVAGYSAIALGITAFILFGAYSSASPNNAAPFGELRFFNAWPDVLGGFAAFSVPTSNLNLPGFYTGLGVIVFAFVYLCLRSVSAREKAVFLITAAVIIICSNHNLLDYIFNGFLIPRGLPQRYTFLIAFLFVSAGYKACARLDELTPKMIVLSAGLAFGLLTIIFFGIQAIFVLSNFLLLCVYIILLYFYANLYKQPRKPAVFGVLFIITAVVMLAELTLTSHKGIVLDPVNASEIPPTYADVTALIKTLHSNEGYYRTETDRPTVMINKSNGSALYGYNGISFFSSTIDTSTARFYASLGLCSALNSYGYAQTSPVADLFLAMRYMLSLSEPADSSVFWREAAGVGSAAVYENAYFLPFGFMASLSLADYTYKTGNPFDSQNELFSLATDITENVFTNVPHTFIMPAGGTVYAYTPVPAVVIVTSGDTRETFLITEPYIFAAGSFDEGAQVEISTQGGLETPLYAAVIRRDVFERGYAVLADETLTLTHFTDTYIKGRIKVKNAGLLYMSAPYKRFWSVYVNGEKAEVIPIGDCMASVYLTEGEHLIELKYRNTPLVIGAVISACSLFVFITFIFKDKRANSIRNTNENKRT